jgi:predicted DNA-binding transcriptional regulator YafY
MATTAARVLELLSLLESRRYWPGPDLAARLGVSARTLRRDVDRLRDLGYPVEAAPGVGGGYQLRAGTALPPLVLDDDEATALVVGLHAAADSGVAGVADSSVRALGKTLGVMPPRLRARAEALRVATAPGGGPPPAAAVDAEVLAVLAGACRDEVRVAFGYVARDGAGSDRYVEPYRLVVLAGRWYLLAFDGDRDDWRTFRVDRVRDPRATVGTFAPRALPAEPVAFVRRSIERAPGHHQVVADVERDARSVTAAIGRWAEVEELGADRCRVRMSADDLSWPVLALLRVDADFSVREPAALAALVATVGARFSRAAVRPPARPGRATSPGSPARPG